MIYTVPPVGNAHGWGKEFIRFCEKVARMR